MNNIKMVATSSYLPETRISNEFFNEKFNLSEDWIKKRTGIDYRYFAKNETITELGIKVSKKIVEENNISKDDIDGIIVATTSTDRIMPGISFEIQKALEIEKCMCLDVLAGCSGFINALDIARKYIALEELKNVLLIGVEKISNYLNFEDINSSIILGDGAGAVLLTSSNEEKIYYSNIKSFGKGNEILTCHNNEKLYMDGKNIYKFAVSKTSSNILETLEKANISKEEIKYFILHQSNSRIIDSICEKIDISKEKVYKNLDKIGNTFCASIPIVLDEINKKGLLKEKDKILLCGYGGGLNLGSIILEI